MSSLVDGHYTGARTFCVNPTVYPTGIRTKLGINTENSNLDYRYVPLVQFTTLLAVHFKKSSLSIDSQWRARFS